VQAFSSKNEESGCYGGLFARLKGRAQQKPFYKKAFFN
jgi:hypothetical protein